MADEFMCASRQQGPSNFPGPDRWRTEPNGDRTCSYCGSLHPDDFAAILEGYSKGEPGFRFGTTDKAYKRYGNRPGVQNAGHGGIKFYTWHLPPEGPELDRLQGLHSAAVARLHKELGL